MAPKGEGTLSLRSSKSGHPPLIPKLKAIELAVDCYLSSSTLLDYRRCHHTNTHFFKISVTIDPVGTSATPLQQHLLTNTLRTSAAVVIDYPGTDALEPFRQADGTPETADELDRALMRWAESVVLAQIRQEVDFAEYLLQLEPDGLLTAVAEKIMDFAEQPDLRSIGGRMITKRLRSVCWSRFLSSCVTKYLEQNEAEKRRPTTFMADRDQLTTASGKRPAIPKIADMKPFLFLDPLKVPRLAAMTGQIKTDYAQSYGDIALAENIDFMGGYEVKVDESLGAFHVHAGDFGDKISSALFALAGAFQIFSQALSKFPCDSERPLHEDTNQKLRSLEDLLSQEWAKAMRRLQKQPSKKVADLAKVLSGELGDEGERLRLAVEQDVYVNGIYFDTLTSLLRDGLSTALKEALRGCLVKVNVTITENEWRSLDEQYVVTRNLSPSIELLRANGAIKEFFESHPWFHKLNADSPNTELRALFRHSADFEDDNIKPEAECILVSGYFSGEPKPKGDSMIVTIKDDIPF